MKKYLIFYLSVISIISLFAAAFPFLANAQGAQTRVVVVFRQCLSDSQKEKVVKRSGFSNVVGHLAGGSVLNVDKNKLNKLKSIKNVEYVEEDIKAYTLGRKENRVYAPAGEKASWGFDKIEVQNAWTIATNKGTGVKVAVIDTGVNLFHPDLKVAGGINTMGGANYNDDNGHGSHVAGIIAAQDNEQGVIGVAPNVSLYAVKALDKDGSGYMSSIVKGIEWAVKNDMDVINLSLGFDTDSQLLHEAIKSAKSAGVTVVVAGGNSGPTTDSVSYPAKYSETIAVSATDQNNNITSWSSNGEQIDVAAPGDKIASTYKGRQYVAESGTSMSAPFITGVVALILNMTVNSSYDSDSDGQWDPDEIQNKIQAAATDLGSSGFDNYYGYGLVNAYNAVK